MNVFDFQRMKEKGDKISIITCYDNWSAKILANTNIDCILVGDSLAMVMHGAKDTIPATVELMAIHTAAVAKGAPDSFIIGDLPFCSYRKDLTTSMNAIEKLMRAGANAVKLEGAIGNEELIEHVVASGIPVMGHLGLTLQSINTMGGFKIQGKTAAQAEKLLEHAKQLEDAGCFAIVLEGMPSAVAKKITDELTIPTIGIGAGLHVSGQVLVLHDILGLYDYIPKFVKVQLDGNNLIKEAVNNYVTEVKTKEFPAKEHCYD